MFTLFVSRGYPTKKYKMQGIFEFDQAKALVKANQKVVFISLDMRSLRRWRKWGLEKLEVEGVNVYSFNIPLGRVYKPLFFKIGDWAINKVFKQVVKDFNNPQVIHAHFTDHGYIASLIKTDIKIPLLITEHSSAIQNLQTSDYMYKVAKKAYSAADQLLVVSEYLGRVIYDKFQIDSIVIPNMVNVEEKIITKSSNDNKFNFVSVGHLIKTKGMDTLIKAFNLAFKDDKNITLNIYGDGFEKNNLEKLINEHNLSDQISLMGINSRDKIFDDLAKSQAFVLASQTETFGLAYVEALSMGLPIIATKCGGPEGFVDNDNGLLVDVDNVEQLKLALLAMVNNIDHYDNQLISEKTKGRFSFEVVAKQIIAVYKNVIDNK